MLTIKSTAAKLIHYSL